MDCLLEAPFNSLYGIPEKENRIEISTLINTFNSLYGIQENKQEIQENKEEHFQFPLWDTYKKAKSRKQLN